METPMVSSMGQEPAATVTDGSPHLRENLELQQMPISIMIRITPILDFMLIKMILKSVTLLQQIVQVRI